MSLAILVARRKGSQGWCRPSPSSTSPSPPLTLLTPLTLPTGPTSEGQSARWCPCMGFLSCILRMEDISCHNAARFSFNPLGHLRVNHSLDVLTGRRRSAIPRMRRAEGGGAERVAEDISDRYEHLHCIASLARIVLQSSSYCTCPQRGSVRPVSCAMPSALDLHDGVGSSARKRTAWKRSSSSSSSKATMDELDSGTILDETGGAEMERRERTCAGSPLD